MKTIKAKDKQTVMDIALEQYGTLEAVGEILAGNPNLTNDPQTLVRLGVDAIDPSDFYPDIMLEQGQAIVIDNESRLIRTNIVKQLNREITTFD